MNAVRRLLLAVHPSAVHGGLLLLRVVFGGFMAVGHGYGKLAYDPASFPDPLGIGPGASYYGAVGAELVCGVLVAVGLFTRAACVPLLFTMLVAAAVVHRADPLFMSGAGGAKEPALLYGAAYVAILLLGPGRVSLDAAIFGSAKA